MVDTVISSLRIRGNGGMGIGNLFPHSFVIGEVAVIILFCWFIISVFLLFDCRVVLTKNGGPGDGERAEQLGLGRDASRG